VREQAKRVGDAQLVCGAVATQQAKELRVQETQLNVVCVRTVVMQMVSVGAAGILLESLELASRAHLSVGCDPDFH
jgi:hypothetical protein